MRRKTFGKGRKKTKKRLPASPSKRTSKRLPIPFIFSIIIVIISISVIELDKRAFPQILEIAHIKSKNKINTVINFSVTEISKQMDLKASDFYYKSFDETGRVCDISVNTILVNEFCSLLTQQISERLLQMGNEAVSLPVGSLSGIRYFANLGPDYTVHLMPMGNAYVSYDCSFDAVGINQVNFQLWLIVDSSVKVVNPLQSQDISINRKVALVNTVISGDVPDTYLNGLGFSPQN